MTTTLAPPEPAIDQPTSPQSTVVAYLRDLYPIGEPVQIPEMVSAVTAQFAEDPGFRETLNRWFFRHAIYEIASERTLKMGDKRWEGISGVSTVGKAYKNASAERVFIPAEEIRMFRPDGALITEPDGRDLFTGHINGPKGPQSTMSYFDYVAPPFVIIFDVLVLDDFLTDEEWGYIWEHAQYNGLGAKRSQGFGTFNQLAFEKIP